MFATSNAVPSYVSWHSSNSKRSCGNKRRNPPWRDEYFRGQNPGPMLWLQVLGTSKARGEGPVRQSSGIRMRQKLQDMQDGNSHDGRHDARTVNATSFCMSSAVIRADVPVQVPLQPGPYWVSSLASCPALSRRIFIAMVRRTAISAVICSRLCESSGSCKPSMRCRNRA